MGSKDFSSPPGSPPLSLRLAVEDTMFTGSSMLRYHLLSGGDGPQCSTISRDEWASVPTPRARRTSPLFYGLSGRLISNPDVSLANAWRFRQAERRQWRRFSRDLQSFSETT